MCINLLCWKILKPSLEHNGHISQAKEDPLFETMAPINIVNIIKIIDIIKVDNLSLIFGKEISKFKLRDCINTLITNSNKINAKPK